MSETDAVSLHEVGPRDGLQNEAEAIPTAAKLALLDRLAGAGLRSIEATSFVSAQWIPQLADAEEVAARLVRRPGVSYSALVPNLAGYQRFARAPFDVAAFFVSASETHNRKNVNRGVAEHLERFRPVAERAKADGVRLRCYVSTVCGCPYEGEVPLASVLRVVQQLLALGADEISLGDTIGVGTPGKAQAMVEAVAAAVPRDRLAAHFHDTYGQALANILAAMERGIATVDCAVAGLGGCPYAPGAAGNVATEDVLYMLDGLDIKTGIDLEAVAAAGRFICDHLGRAPSSKVAQALRARA